MTEPGIHKGLAGVVVDHTAISKVNPESNSLLYRGYPVQELAGHRDMEDVAYLLWNGELPDAAQRQEFDAFERAHRALPEQVIAAIDLLGARRRCPRVQPNRWRGGAHRRGPRPGGRRSRVQRA